MKKTYKYDTIFKNKTVARGEAMKNSIAKVVTKKIAAFLLAAFVMILAALFFLVSYVVETKNQTYSRAVLSVYADSIMDKARLDNSPVDLDHPEFPIYYGQYFVFWLSVDNIYMYVPNIEDGTRTIISLNQKTELGEEKQTDYWTGYKFKREPTEDELGVWTGKKMFAEVKANNQFGHNIGTIMLVEDSFGNKVVAGVDLSYKQVWSQIAAIFAVAGLLMGAVILTVYIAVQKLLKKRISQPAQNIAQKMNDYIVDGKRSSEKLDETGSDEYAMIAGAFNSMTSDIDTYIENINRLNLDKQRQDTELNIAAGIQHGFLPKRHFSDGMYEINAVMTPARNIGGDIYDYLPLDRNRVLVVIADVSGKGISASMFMSVTLILIHQYAKLDLSPAEILEKTNDTLFERNASILFATAFVGIYDKRTGEFTCANAGHNLPYIVGSTVREIKIETGTPLGLFEKEKYQQSVIKLNIGESIFMYTDGVTEAINQNREFFGTERLIKELEKISAENANIVEAVGKSVKEFSGSAEQYDDITMLNLSIRGATELMLDLDVHEMKKIKDTVLAIDSIPKKVQRSLCLVAEEYFVNICYYAFEDGVPEGEKVKFVLSVTDKIEMTFEDGGQQFNPLDDVENGDNYDIDTRIGGLGRFIAMSIIDDAKYEYKNSKNILKLIKNFEEDNQ